jgi:hypothetical protein
MPHDHLETLLVTTGASAPGATADAGAAEALDTWQGRQEVHRTERIPRSAFVQQLDWETDAPLEGGSPVLQLLLMALFVRMLHNCVFGVVGVSTVSASVRRVLHKTHGASKAALRRAAMCRRFNI